VRRGSDTPQVFEWVDGSWLMLKYAPNPVIRLDATRLDRVMASDSNVVVGIRDMTVRLRVSRGPEGAVDISQRLHSFTRSAPLRADCYDAAKRRLGSIVNGRMAEQPMLYLGRRAVTVGNEVVYIGDVQCSILEIEKESTSGRIWFLPNSHGIQAALLMLAVAAHVEDDPDVLARRVKEFEQSNISSKE
jgi:hypothetical protein